MQKGMFDEVACKHLLLTTPAAKEFFVENIATMLTFLSVSFRVEVIFLYCELLRLTHGVVEQVWLLIHDGEARVN